MNQTFKLLTLLLAVTLLTGCNKTEELDFTRNITEHFDKEFALQLEKREYITDATKITYADVKDIKNLEVGFGKLTSLSGIEYFSALDTLYCQQNWLTTLDVSKNTALTYLICTGNRLTTLDFSKNTVLTKLHCDSNQLTALDISNNTALEQLYCGNNKLTELDISNNTALVRLYCPFNQLTTLDVSNNMTLDALSCEFNPGNGAAFPVTAWFDNNSIPNTLTRARWDYNGNWINIEYIKK